MNPSHATSAPANPEMRDVFSTRFGTAEIVKRAAALEAGPWRDALASFAKDSRYYEICEAALAQANFQYRYLVLRDGAGTTVAVQPLFFTDQDILAGIGAGPRALVAKMRRIFPRFLTMKMLMVGCTAGEGHPGFLAPEAAPALFEALRVYSRREKTAIITFKDFPAAHRSQLDAPAKGYGYVRMPSFPSTILKLDFASFDDYVARKLGKAMRKNLRRKFRKVDEETPLTLEVTSDVSGCVDEVHALYQQVLARSNFRFEELTRDYFLLLGEKMADRARFFVWRREGRAVAFSACIVHEGTLYDNYLGLDYAVALDLHLYFVTIRDVIEWCIQQGLQSYYSTPLNYDPKLHLRFDLAPLDLYVRHVTDWINPFFTRIAPLLEPTRYDKFLPQFANHADLA